MATLRDERGSGTVLAIGVMGVLAFMCAAILLIGGVYAAKSRAQSAADLASLAGAGAIIAGRSESDACAIAKRIAEANDAQIVLCGTDSTGRVTVGAAVRLHPMGASAKTTGLADGLLGPATATAIAGPPPAGEPD